ncbi:hypothetical protein FBU59_002014 [Linderina macrospora]|uniref:Uncharacterized protein n=1 Tax=Linderina macrospora TaxID=4868 RepID=A0ACC1JCB5_9FUNG|nr:hypothetical protein FBU59_002014 [Linderina macrospora]
MLAGLFGAVQSISRPALFGPQTSAVRTMAKLKTHKGAAKRWKAIANGQFQRQQEGLRHFNRRLTPSSRRSKHAPMLCTSAQRWHLQRLLPTAK